MRDTRAWFGTASSLFFLVCSAPFAFAQAVVGDPKPWEMGMQRAYGPLKEREISLHTEVLWIITLITLFVAGLLIYVIFKFNAAKNPTPSKTSHNAILEVAWTVIPVLILIAIAIPSFKLIYYQDRTSTPDLTVKVTGHQWYWEYTYPDQGNFSVESHYIDDEDLKPGQLRLLAVDNQMVIPVHAKVRILTGSSDVIHSFFVPSLGVQRYAIPGRLIETWLEADHIGTFYGECNQICGQNHSRMPISIKVVTEAEFKNWAAGQKNAMIHSGMAVAAR
jgi:cytochrome c oxidase subunit 2